MHIHPWGIKTAASLLVTYLIPPPPPLPLLPLSLPFSLWDKQKELLERWRRTFHKAIDANGDGTADVKEFVDFLDPSNEYVSCMVVHVSVKNVLRAC